MPCPHPTAPLLLATTLALAACGGGTDDPTPDDTPVDDTPAEQADPPDDDADAPDDAEAPDADDPEDAEVPGEEPADEPADEPKDDDADDDAADDDAADDEPDLSVDVTLTEVGQLPSPTAGAVGPDGTLYLADRAGTVHPLGDDGVDEPVVDIAAETSTDGERGLLGLAFADDGEELYLSSTDPAGDTIVRGVAVRDGQPDPDEQRVIYTLEQPRSNHNGGDLAVGPDGMLYLAPGDGGGSGDPDETGQDLSTPLGAMLRLDPSTGDPYEVPDDNPFVDRDDAAPEIVAYGLRNPWRFSFDRETDQLWIADVGQDEREEINRVDLDGAIGANFGWNLMEGTLEFAGSEPDDHVPPVYEYDTRGAEGCAVTGGYVYRGQAIPELRGAYLYADYCNGVVRGLVVDDDGEVVDQAELGIDGGQVVSFAQDEDGELYVLDLDGPIHRIDPA